MGTIESARLWWKRPLDLLLVALSAGPVLLTGAAIAALVLFRLGRPIFFVQERPGLAGRSFRLWKFRTMRAGGGPDAERLTAFGRWLRSTSLDEVPNWWNVARGDMSFVGPRPLLPEYVSLYDHQQMRRMAVRPGVTGWAQIHGRNAVDWNERFALDTWYVDHATPWVDFRILARTAHLVLTGRGVSQAGEATMRRFTGGR